MGLQSPKLHLHTQPERERERESATPTTPTGKRKEFNKRWAQARLSQASKLEDSPRESPEPRTKIEGENLRLVHFGRDSL